MNFIPFPKIARLSREIVITEKLDGTNAQITIAFWPTSSPIPGNAIGAKLGHVAVDPDTLCSIEGNLVMFAGSRNRWIVPGDDNFGFALWAQANADELFALGEGSHFGEWWGQGVGRRYGMPKKVFSLFNVGRWHDGIDAGPDKTLAPGCCSVVPTLYVGPNDDGVVGGVLDRLRLTGSVASPGFMDPEGVIVYHTAAKTMFKKTIKGDEAPKGQLT